MVQYSYNIYDAGEEDDDHDLQAHQLHVRHVQDCARGNVFYIVSTLNKFTVHSEYSGGFHSFCIYIYLVSVARTGAIFFFFLWIRLKQE